MDIAALIFALVALILFIVQAAGGWAFAFLTASWVAQMVSLTGQHIRVH